ncbi:hypothetical protein MSUIS_00820 [Mycoplasma suis KI3806]|uniref:Uncharacterized protein n=1 Tax=Mycoplasma suis (strain KI_3806) TaxID=708248 RepID=F0V2V3_MYCS3|nr:hypothetical protein [Mycoplasma suis]CBZ40175.1 hypothetical protein MSUIS_00820 [Mycoplasma suis KI3806]
MFGAATWVKIALAIFSVGGAAGGTYLIKNSSNIEENFKKGKPDSLIENTLDSEVSTEDSSAGKSEILQNRNEDQGQERQDLSITTPAAGGDKLDSNIQSQNKVLIPTNEEGGDLKNTDHKEKESSTSNSESSQTNTQDDIEVQNSSEPENNVQKPEVSSSGDLSSQTAENQEEQREDSANPSLQQMQSDSPIISATEGQSGRRQDKTIFGEGGNADVSITGEYILSKGDDSKNICVKISQGIGREEKDNSECEKMVSKNLGNEESRKKSRVWVKVNEKKHVKKVLEVLGINSNNGDDWLENKEKELKVNDYFGGSIVCKLEDKSSEEDSLGQGVYVNCLAKESVSYVESTT